MKFLQKIIVGKKLSRITITKSVNKAIFNYKKWIAIETPPTTVYFLGYRTLRNGYLDYRGYEEGTLFKSDGTVKAALVIKNRIENPFYVPVETMRPVEEIK